MALDVLIVDDSPAMRSFMRRVLDLSGLETGVCAEAADGVEALEFLAARRVDVVMTDINMPRMDGEELVRRITAAEDLRTIPVLVVSTDGTEIRMNRMLAMGARGYIRKPFTAEALRDALEGLAGVVDAGI
jgi:two-component system chemotaxis response regulator CheY